MVAPEDTTLPIQSPTMLITAPQKHAEVIEGEESEDEDDDDEEEKKDIQYTKEEDSKQEQAQIPQEKKNVTESSIPPSKTTITVSPTKEPGIVSPVVPPVSQQQPIEVPPPPPATPLEKRVRALNEDVRKVTAKKIQHVYGAINKELIQASIALNNTLGVVQDVWENVNAFNENTQQLVKNIDNLELPSFAHKKPLANVEPH